MAHRLRAVLLMSLIAGSTAGEALACGDKFLVVGRGTRYQRPKTARAAAVLIYADPASTTSAALRSARLEAALKREGHHATLVETPDQLKTILAGGRFDVILTSANVTTIVERVVDGVPAAAAIVTLDAQPRGRSLVEAIDRAVEKRDKGLRKTPAAE